MSRVTIIFLLLIPTLHALQIASYNATLHERFLSGFPSAPVPNPNYQYAHLDLSGVGWLDKSNQFAVTLISPRHLITAAHVGVESNDTVSFLSPEGDRYTATVAASATPVLTYSNGNATVSVAADITIHTLSEPIPDSAGIRHYPILDLGLLPTAYLGLDLIIYGQKGRTGTNLWIGYSIPDSGRFLNQMLSAMPYQSASAGSAQGQSGDSGSPTLVETGSNIPLLLGIHSAIGTDNNISYTFDTPLFPYIGQISEILSQTNQTLATYRLTGDELLAYALTPAKLHTQGDLSHLPKVTMTANNALSITFTAHRPTVIYEVQQSTDLQDWAPLQVIDGGSGQEITVESTSTESEKLFLRLKVSAQQ